MAGQLVILDAGDIDPHFLADLRVAAMRPSLEALGRFDPERARNRFLSGYDASLTRLLYANKDLAGFFVVRPKTDHFYLDHLYLHPAHQNKGYGREVLSSLQDTAKAANKPIRLLALKASPANAFYASCGFVLERSEAIDNHLAWYPPGAHGEQPGRNP